MRNVAVAILLILSSCKQYQPTKNMSNLSSADAARACKNKDVLSAKAGSKVAWTFTQTRDQAESTSTGTNLVSGFLEVANNDLKTASGKFYFDAKSTSSGDRERDSLLMNVVFGLARKMEFSFLLTGLNGTSLPSGSSQGMEATGTLLIDGQSASVKFPVILTERAGIYSLENKGEFLLNMRSLKPATNGMNLDAELKQLLSHVPGMNVKDTVSIKLNIDFENLCSN